MRSMCSKSPSSGGEAAIEDMASLSVQDFKPGDTACIRANGCLYWPVQVVDEKSVSCKPEKQKNNQILVRLYGTYEHLYVEPVDCFLKIENMFDQFKSSNRELFEKALEEDIAKMKSGGHSKGRVYESKGTENDEAPKEKRQKRGKSKRTLNLIPDNFPLVDSSDNPKADKKVNKGVKYKGIDGMKDSVEEKRDEMKNSVLKRKTRSETFKERSAVKNESEVMKDPQNESNGTSTNCLNEEDLGNWRNEDAKEKETATIRKNKETKVKDIKQDCLLDRNINNNVEFEVSNVKDIKQLVTKIVKEVAAEKVRNLAFKAKVTDDGSGNTKWTDNSRKEISLIENHMKQCSPGEVKKITSLIKRQYDLHEGRSFDNEKIERADDNKGCSDNEKTERADDNKGSSDNEKNERSDDNSTKQSLIREENVADQAKNRTRRTNIVNHRPLTRSKSLISMKMVEDENSQANVAKKVVMACLRDKRREQMEIPVHKKMEI